MKVPHSSPQSSGITSLVVAFRDGRKVEVFGRDAWALNELMSAGAEGCTPINNPAPRWSHYVWKLRGEGIDIETVDEPHGGTYGGSHARYVLRSKLRKVTATYAGADRPTAKSLSQARRRAA